MAFDRGAQQRDASRLARDDRGRAPRDEPPRARAPLRDRQRSRDGRRRGPCRLALAGSAPRGPRRGRGRGLVQPPRDLDLRRGRRRARGVHREPDAPPGRAHRLPRAGTGHSRRPRRAPQRYRERAEPGASLPGRRVPRAGRPPPITRWSVRSDAWGKGRASCRGRGCCVRVGTAGAFVRRKVGDRAGLPRVGVPGCVGARTIAPARTAWPPFGAGLWWAGEGSGSGGCAAGAEIDRGRRGVSRGAPAWKWRRVGVVSRKKGDLIEGYRILDELGRGAASIIYLVQEPKNKSIFALKHVIKVNPKDQRFLDQAEAEAKVAQALDHPGIRKIYKVIKVGSFLSTRELLLLMELVDGQSVDVHPPKSMIEAVEIFKQVATALQHMHERGFVHADMKPNNVCVTDAGAVKIIDLGQSCKVGTVKERIQGTPDYIAPEQVHRRAITPKTDVYNLGATLYWVLTRRHIPTALAKGDSLVNSLDDNLIERPKHIKELNPRVHDRLAELVMQCVEIDASARPESMQVVAERLDMVGAILKAARNTESAAAIQANQASQAHQAGQASRAGQRVEPVDGEPVKDE
ncbi:MAG: hypothetical protein EA378_01975 [Phycisphaerales bacterium]|nr:MAG: hypothetical protein EA378_01975 [Phycisphaerales bacterium]